MKALFIILAILAFLVLVFFVVVWPKLKKYLKSEGVLGKDDSDDDDDFDDDDDMPISHKGSRMDKRKMRKEEEFMVKFEARLKEEHPEFFTKNGKIKKKFKKSSKKSTRSTKTKKEKKKKKNTSSINSKKSTKSSKTSE